MRRIRVIGVGMGPQHVTPEAADALRSVDYVLAFAKGEDDPLLEARADLCRTYDDRPLVVVPDPPRDRADPEDYPRAVREWHEARVAAHLRVLDERPGDVGMLVWGDPSLYDSTLRIVEAIAQRTDVVVDVTPGISAPQLLAARHRLVLHEVGRPVHVTTGRRLREAIEQGQDNIVVMLNRTLDLAELEDWQIWWGANLGTPSEALVAGPGGRRAARGRGGRATGQRGSRLGDGHLPARGCDDPARPRRAALPWLLLRHAEKHPSTDHDAQRDALLGCDGAGGVRVRVVDCLDQCDRSNVVLVRDFTGGRRPHDTWLGGVLNPRTTEHLVTWVQDGGALPRELVPHRFGSNTRGRT